MEKKLKQGYVLQAYKKDEKNLIGNFVKCDRLGYPVVKEKIDEKVAVVINQMMATKDQMTEHHLLEISYDPFHFRYQSFLKEGKRVGRKTDAVVYSSVQREESDDLASLISKTENTSMMYLHPRNKKLIKRRDR